MENGKKGKGKRRKGAGEKKEAGEERRRKRKGRAVFRWGRAKEKRTEGQRAGLVMEKRPGRGKIPALGEKKGAGRREKEKKEGRAGKKWPGSFLMRGERRRSGKRQKGKGEKKRRGWTREKEKARPKVAGQREKRIEGQGARKNGLFCFWGGGKKERGVQSSMPKRRIAARCSAKRRSSCMAASGRGFFIVHPYTMRAPFSLAGRGMASVK